MSQNHLVGLQCTKCKNVNYNTTRNRKSVEKKLALVKFCKTCKKRTPHKEVKM